MTRLALGITLSIIAIAIAIAGCISFFHPVGFVCPLAPRAALVTHFFEGRMRLFWITRDDQPIRVTHHWRGPTIAIVSRNALTWQDGREVLRDPRRATQDGDLVRINIGDRRGVGAFGGQWRSGSVNQAPAPPGSGIGRAPARAGGGLEVSFVRTPMWLPVLLLLLQPVKAIILGPWLTRRRERLNQCIGCGYDLRALPSPRCPECGRRITESSPWDLQFKADVDGLADEALRELRSGRCKDL